MAQHGADDLRLVAIALVEQRPDGAVDQAGDQGLLLARASLALEEAAGDLARGEGLLLVVDGEREEVDALPRALGAHGGAEHDGLAIAGEHGAVGLPRDAARFQGQRAAAPLDGYFLWIQHGLLSL